MVRSKKRKHSSIDPPQDQRKGGDQPNLEPPAWVKEIEKIREEIEEVRQGSEKVRQESEKVSLEADKWRPMQKKFVTESFLSMTNEFIGFIGQIHKTGYQPKFKKNHTTGKYSSLSGNSKFKDDCTSFLKDHNGASGNTLAHIINIFSGLCDERNKIIHYEEPEMCFRDILKYRQRYLDMMGKCSPEVQYCVGNIEGIAVKFIGPYRLRRMACEYICRFLISKNKSWTSLEELETVMRQSKKLLAPFKPEGTGYRVFKVSIQRLFLSTTSEGPKWTGVSQIEDNDYRSIQSTFERCVNFEMLPPKENHPLEYSILEHKIQG